VVLRLNEEKLAPGADTAMIRTVFPNITGVGRAEQKRRLLLAVEKYQDDKTLLESLETEDTPLCFPGSIFKSHT
jgi:hypothetical protein